MKFLFNNYEVGFINFNSRHEFDYYTNASHISYLTLSDDFEENCVLVSITGVENRNYFYSVADECAGKILFSKLYSSLIFLLGKKIICVSPDHSLILWNIELSTNIVSVIESVEDNAILVVGEAEILSINNVGEIKWKKLVDLIANYKMHGNSIELQFYDDKSMVLDKLTGKIVPSNQVEW